MVALVIDAKELFKEPVKVDASGIQHAVLRVVSRDGGFTLVSSTPSGKGERLKPGDVVLWVPSVYDETIAAELKDKRSGWQGLIRAKVKPETHPDNPNFAISCRYDP